MISYLRCTPVFCLLIVVILVSGCAGNQVVAPPRTTAMPASTVIPVPVADFYTTSVSGFTPLKVSFVDCSMGGPTSWYWDFGDGQSSTLEYPNHTYDRSGNYNVSLTATNAEGSNTRKYTNYITVYATPTPMPTPVSPPRSLDTGTFIVQNLTGGQGQLIIDNGLLNDSVIILTSTSDQKKVLSSVYVKRRCTYTITGIPDGSYTVYELTGMDWDSNAKLFTESDMYVKLDGSMNFVTTSTQYTYYSLTIGHVEYGSGSGMSISPNEIPKF